MNTKILQQVGFMMMAGAAGMGVGMGLMWGGRTASAANNDDFSTPSLTYVAQVDATCTTAGTKAYWRSSDGKFYSDAGGLHQILSNEMDEWVIIEPQHNVVYVEREETCAHAGHKAYWHCGAKGCGKNFYDQEAEHEIADLSAIALPQKKHTVSDEMVAEKTPTCAEPGWVAHYECESCGQDFDADHKPFNATWTVDHHAELVDVVLPSCEEAGCMEHYHCADCGQNFADESCERVLTAEEMVIAPTGHEGTYYEDEVLPTCTEDGHPEYWECIHCHQNFIDSQTPYDPNNLPVKYRAREHNYQAVYQADPTTPVAQVHYLQDNGKVMRKIKKYLQCTNDCHDVDHDGEVLVEDGYVIGFASLNSSESQNVVDNVANYVTHLDGGKNIIDEDVFQINTGDTKARIVLDVPQDYTAAKSCCRCNGVTVENLSALVRTVQVNELVMDLPAEAGVWEFDWDGDGLFEQKIRIAMI